MPVNPGIERSGGVGEITTIYNNTVKQIEEMPKTFLKRENQGRNDSCVSKSEAHLLYIPAGVTVIKAFLGLRLIFSSYFYLFGDAEKRGRLLL